MELAYMLIAGHGITTHTEPQKKFHAADTFQPLYIIESNVMVIALPTLPIHDE